MTITNKTHSEMRVVDQVFSWGDNHGLGEILTLGYRPRIKFTSKLGSSNEAAILRSELTWNGCTKRWETDSFPSDIIAKCYSEWKLNDKYDSLYDSYFKNHNNLTFGTHNDSFFIIELAMYYAGIQNAFIDCVFVPFDIEETGTKANEYLQYDVRFYSLTERLVNTFVLGLAQFAKVFKRELSTNSPENKTLVSFRLYKETPYVYPFFGRKLIMPTLTEHKVEFITLSRPSPNTQMRGRINRERFKLAEITTVNVNQDYKLDSVSESDIGTCKVKWGTNSQEPDKDVVYSPDVHLGILGE